MSEVRQSPTLEDYASTASRRTTAGPRHSVSLVTICLNARDTIGRTIDSVHAQSFADIEHIIIDGGSTDGTQSYVETRLRPGDFLLSEPDRGISDAFNKGVALARGQFVQFINADDWLSENQIEKAVGLLDRSGADFVFGDLIFYERGVASFLYRGDPAYSSKLYSHMPAMNHPTVLARRTAYERIGLFSLEYRCAMEYDWFQRLHRAGGCGAHDSSILGHMVHEGVSNRQYRRTFAEVRSIAVKYGRSVFAARADEALRLAKVRAAFVIRRRSDGLYRFARRAINRAYSRL